MNMSEHNFENAAGVLPSNPDIDAPPEAFIRGARDDFEPLYRHYRAKAEEFYAVLATCQAEKEKYRDTLALIAGIGAKADDDEVANIPILVRVQDIARAALSNN